MKEEKQFNKRIINFLNTLKEVVESLEFVGICSQKISKNSKVNINIEEIEDLMDGLKDINSCIDIMETEIKMRQEYLEMHYEPN
jgi:hypothetical protein